MGRGRRQSRNMDQREDNKFRSAYRKCLRTNALKKNIECVREIISTCVDDFQIEKAHVDSFIRIEGYKVVISGSAGFFPKEKTQELEQEYHLRWLRETFLKAEFVSPPLLAYEFLSEIAKEIMNATSPSEIEQVIQKHGPRMYPIKSLASLHENIYRLNPIVSPYSKQIQECIEAFHFGLFGAAITGLIPCIEGIIRDTGKKINIACDEHVSLHQFIDIIEKLQQRILKKYVFREYSWAPVDFMNIDFHDHFNEQIQILQSLKFYLNNSLYMHTQSFSSATGLNRNGVVHGFITNFNSAENFYRLVTVLNLLYVCTLFAGESGSMFHPPIPDTPTKFETRLRAISAMKEMLEKMPS